MIVRECDIARGNCGGSVSWSEVEWAYSRYCSGRRIGDEEKLDYKPPTPAPTTTTTLLRTSASTTSATTVQDKNISVNNVVLSNNQVKKTVIVVVKKPSNNSTTSAGNGTIAQLEDISTASPANESLSINKTDARTPRESTHCITKINCFSK